VTATEREVLEQWARRPKTRQARDATHWSTRAMATRSGLSQTTIRRIWHAFALQPHRSETFKLAVDTSTSRIGFRCIVRT
jgi:transcriptional regulator with XRE-family HTH domain